MPTITPVERALLKRKKKTRRALKRPARQATPDSIEREYMRKFNKILNRLEKLIKARVVKELPKLVEQHNKKLPTSDRMDATIAQKVAKLFVSIEKSLADLPTSMVQGAAEDIAKKTNKFNKAQVAKVFKSVVGVDLLGKEPWLAEQLEMFSIGNANLISDVSQQFINNTQQTVMEGLRQGLRHEEIAKRILSKSGKGLASDLRKAKKRAALIARDQVSKLNGQLTQLRQENVGVQKYIWRTVRDSRVRNSHREREGKEFDWSNPPSDGHPGEPINCRCFAEPVLDDII